MVRTPTLSLSFRPHNDPSTSVRVQEVKEFGKKGKVPFYFPSSASTSPLSSFPEEKKERKEKRESSLITKEEEEEEEELEAKLRSALNNRSLPPPPPTCFPFLFSVAVLLYLLASLPVT